MRSRRVASAGTPRRKEHAAAHPGRRRPLPSGSQGNPSTAARPWRDVRRGSTTPGLLRARGRFFSSARRNRVDDHDHGFGRRPRRKATRGLCCDFVRECLLEFKNYHILLARKENGHVICNPCCEVCLRFSRRKQERCS